MDNKPLKPIDEIKMMIKNLKTDVKDIKRDVSIIKDSLPKTETIVKDSSETESSSSWFFS